MGHTCGEHNEIELPAAHGLFCRPFNQALGASEDTHGICDGCIPAKLLPPGSNSTGCPTTFPNGPGLGATFSRTLWCAA